VNLGGEHTRAVGIANGGVGARRYQRCLTRDSSREIACDNKFGDSCRPASSLMISREAVAYCSYGREPMVGCRPHGLAPKVATAVGSIGRIPAGNRRLRELGSFFVP
jgi:hypothetical protein